MVLGFLITFEGHRSHANTGPKAWERIATSPRTAGEQAQEEPASRV